MLIDLVRYLMYSIDRQLKQEVHPMEEAVYPIEYRKDYAITQANELVRSKQDDLTLLEAKLIKLAISQVLQNDKDFRTYSCNVADLAKFLNIASKKMYDDVYELSKSIMKKSIIIKDKDTKRGKPNYKIFHWVDLAEYNNGTITFRLSESLAPYLLGLNELFTKYNYDAILALPTSYSIRLYELLISWKNAVIRKEYKAELTYIHLEQNEVIFTIDYLRSYFNCEDKYPNTSDFIFYVIDKAVKSINEKTINSISYRKVKKGRSMAYIVFRFEDLTEPTGEAKERFEAAHRVYEELMEGL